MEGFFANNPSVVSSAPRCQSCGLKHKCNTPRMAPSGLGKMGVLVVGEAPGEREDREGIQLIGKSGQLLRRHLNDLGIKLDRDCWKTNAVNCRPPENRTPTAKEIVACRPFLLKLIKEKNPKVVILLGTKSVQSLLGPLWKKDIGSISRWVGCLVPCREYNVWIAPNWHPSYLLRQNSEVLESNFRDNLRRAFSIESHPYKSSSCKNPYTQKIKVLKNPDSVLTYIESFLEANNPIAFDFETDRLKPDADGSSIFSCAISDGECTIAYPWVGDAIAATSKLLRSRVPKIGANIKFEERWTRKILGHGVRNWVWDCMVAAHTLNNTPGITSVKFQSFVRFGVGDYSSNISSFLEAGGKGNTENKIKQVKLSDLLLYNGMDALMEYKIAQQQMEEINE